MHGSRERQPGRKWTVVGMSVAALVATIGGSACGGAQPEPAATSAELEVDLLGRGEYLVNAMGCHDCHTPFQMGPQGPEPDMSRMLTGHPRDLVMPPAPGLPEGPWLWVGAATNTAFAGPWGVSYATNLTPDENTGLGIWTEEMFVGALRTGRHMNTSRLIMPPMPWPAYRNLSDEDLRAIFTYLQSLPPRANQVPEPVISELWEELSAR